MKKLLLFVTMAASLLFTQCKKEESVSSAGKTVRMTVTAGPGSKTDITDAGTITWSDGDKLYVGDGTQYIGCLTLVGDGGSATGTFSGNVTLPTDTKDGEKSFGFFYLGSAERTLEDGDETAEVDFSSQNIYAEDGKLQNASACHVGYGSATGTVINDVVTDINVMLVSKVALAHFSFKKGDAAYTDGLTLKGDNIYNEMTVNFDGTFTGKDGSTTDGISLGNGHGERYVMLVPTGDATAQSLTFTGDNVSGSYPLENGIKPNQFYGKDEAIPVTLEAAAPAGRFTVDANGTKVDFAPGNLYWDGSAFKFEADQWSFASTWNKNHVSHFFWSNTTDWQASGKEPYASSFSYSTRTTSDVFFTEAESFKVGNETGWRTLSKAEWDYLLNSRTDASSLRTWKDLGNNVKGLVILPDGTENPSTVMGGITSTADLASSGAVFLPASGIRGTGVNYVGSYGFYWSSTPVEDYEVNAYDVVFNSGDANTNYGGRNFGYAVRLVR